MIDGLRPPLAVTAPAKINLGLFVGPPRPDGRHELVSVMQSISLADELRLEWAQDGAAGDIVDCPGVDGENLAARALEEMRRRALWRAPPVRLSIAKRIPVAAGMGGGSADAAAALRLVVAVSGWDDELALVEVAAGLGADVPAQVSPGRWLASGIGERLRELPDPGAGVGVLVLPVAGGLSTAAVYREFDRIGRARSPVELRQVGDALAIELAAGRTLTADELLHNDLQDAARALSPAIDVALEEACDRGADIALVSGSGPTVIGLFDGPDGVRRAATAAARARGRQLGAFAATPVGSAFGSVRRL